MRQQKPDRAQWVTIAKAIWWKQGRLHIEHIEGKSSLDFHAFYFLPQFMGGKDGTNCSALVAGSNSSWIITAAGAAEFSSYPQTLPMEGLGHMSGFYAGMRDKGFPQLLFCDAGEPFSRTGRQMNAFVTPLLHGDAVTSFFLSNSLFPSGFLPICVEKSLGLEGR